MTNAGPGGHPETGDDHNERTVVINTDSIHHLDLDPDCPLLDVPGHECANRDYAERRAAGLSVLRPGSTCFEGAAYAMAVEGQARAFAAHMADRLGRLLAVIRFCQLDTGDLEIEVREAAAALGLFNGASGVAGWAA